MNENVETQKIYQVTLRGTIINVLLLALKFAAAILGHSAAILADAVHSLSDLLTDIIVLISVKLGFRPHEKPNDFFHGRFELLSTAFVGLIIFVIGLILCYNGTRDTIRAFQGTVFERPGYIALFAAILSIILKEWAYRFTIRTARDTGALILAANAWHHRSDAFSSIGTTIGIFFAIILGVRWRVLDPLTSVIVSIFIIRVAVRLIFNAITISTETKLPEDIEHDILDMVNGESEVAQVHQLMARRMGDDIAVEMRLSVPGNLTVSQAHQHTTHIEHILRDKYGPGTYVGIYIEPENHHPSEDSPMPEP